MVFSSNPLSLSVPDHSFETWLRDTGYLEVLDHRSSSSAAAVDPSAGNLSSSSAGAAAAALTGDLFVSFFSSCLTLVSLLTLNPLAKLSTDDFAGPTPSWTRAFFADCGSYSFPSGPDQARLRAHENVKRYARNYASLFIVFFACTLYKMPLALIGLISSLGLWEAFMFFSKRWNWDQYPVARLVLVRAAQFATLIILMYLNVQLAIFCALGVSYAAMVLHASFRKLTPVKQHSRQRK